MFIPWIVRMVCETSDFKELVPGVRASQPVLAWHRGLRRHWLPHHHKNRGCGEVTGCQGYWAAEQATNISSTESEGPVEMSGCRPPQVASTTTRTPSLLEYFRGDGKAAGSGARQEAPPPTPTTSLPLSAALGLHIRLNVASEPRTPHRFSSAVTISAHRSAGRSGR
jgi:hypothetical protein